VHSGPVNRGTSDVVLTQSFEPGTRGAQRYVRELARALDDGLDWRGDLSPVRALAMLDGRHPDTYLPGLSRRMQRRMLFPAARQVIELLDTRRAQRDDERNAIRLEEEYWAGVRADMAARAVRARRDAETNR
jgi:hypothetical protein